MKLFYLLTFVFTSFTALGESFNQHQVNITRFGSHDGQIFYLSLDQAFKTNCAWGNLYCPATNPNCEQFMSIALSAKLASKPLSRITYKQETPDASCQITLIELD